MLDKIANLFKPKRIERPIFGAKKSVTATGDRGWHSIGSLYSPIASSWTEADKIWEKRDLYSLCDDYKASSIIFACIRELTRAVCDAPLKVGYENDEGEWEEAADHEALAAFYEHPDYAATDIFSQTIERLELTGAAFALLSGYVSRIGAALFTPLPTQQVQVHAVGPTITGYTLILDGKEVPLKREEVCAVFHLDPQKFLGYVSPFATVQREYQIDRERESLTIEIMKNRKIPGGYLETQSALSKEQREQLKQSVDAAVGRTGEQRGSLMILPQGMKFQIGGDVKDIDFSVLNAIAESRICMAFGIPPILIGAKAGLDRATYSNYREARKAFYSETIKPLWTMLASAFTRTMLPREGGDRRYEFWFDYSEISELQRDMDAAANRAKTLFDSQLLTRNEARKHAGFEPAAAGGDEYKPTPAPTAFGAPREEGKALQGKALAAIGHFDESGRLERALSKIFRKQRKEVLGKVQSGARIFDLSHWNGKVTEVVKPIFAEIYESNARALFNRLNKRAGEFSAKAETPQPSFDLIRIGTLNAMEDQLREFAESVNATTGKRLDKAIQDVIETARKENTVPSLTKAVNGVFSEFPQWRSRMIAITESSRAIHDSKVIAAHASGVVRGFKAVVSEDACDLCQYYNAEGEPTGVAIDFYTSLEDAVKQVGEYDRNLPPFHPNCRCTQVEVLDIDEPPSNPEIPDTWETGRE